MLGCGSEYRCGYVSGAVSAARSLGRRMYEMCGCIAGGTIAEKERRVAYGTRRAQCHGRGGRPGIGGSAQRLRQQALRVRPPSLAGAHRKVLERAEEHVPRGGRGPEVREMAQQLARTAAATSPPDAPLRVFWRCQRRNEENVRRLQARGERGQIWGGASCGECV